jgi:hypothetical protein
VILSDKAKREGLAQMELHIPAQSEMFS